MINDNAVHFAVSIKEAGEQLENICLTYLEKDRTGNFIIPVNRQRPVLLMGPSGIGKTDVPKQTAEKLGLGYVSYSITHHTRQSALGLPKIAERSYGGERVLTTEYTASEIITAVRDDIEKNGRKNGILFLDEVNCVSETLAAPMLQLFQSKTMGNSSIPEGWILVMAGNPSEYNRSAKDFDAATLDRLRIINVKPDSEAWITYAENKGLNETVISYISSDSEKLYGFDGDSKGIVTPRGWEELSVNIDSYIRHGFEITAGFVNQFIGIPDTAQDFHDYYMLVTKEIRKEQIDMIVRGTFDTDFCKEAAEGSRRLRYMLITCLKKRLHAACVSNKATEAEKIMNNIISFIEQAYGDSGEMEIFMSRLLSDPDIVQMSVKTQNKKFEHYLNTVVSADNTLRRRLKSAV